MFRKRLSTVLILLAAVGICYHDPAMGDTSDQFAQAAQIADAYWPGSRCAGVEQVTVVDDLISFHAGYAAPDPDDPSLFLAGWADFFNGHCNVQVDSRMTVSAYDYCRVLVHEFGHLAASSEAHSTEPANVMFAVIPTVVPACAPLLPAPTPVAVVAPAVAAASPSPAAHPVAVPKVVRHARVHKHKEH